jgi:hypothetical protein
MRKFLAGFAVVAMLAGPLAACGGGSSLPELFAKTKELTPRQDLERTLALARVLAVAIDEAFKNEWVDPASKLGRDLAFASNEMTKALKAWTANPDSITYRTLAKEAFKVAKRIYDEVKR